MEQTIQEKALPPLTEKLIWIMAKDYGVTESTVGFVATMTQVGLALGLLFILPLADILEKKRLILTMNVAAIVALLVIYMAHHLTIVTLFSCILGFTSVIPQLMIPLSAALAKTGERGVAIGKVMTGLLLGLLYSFITAIYMVSFFVGGALGSYAGTWGFEHFQWLGVCLMGLVSQDIALLAFWWDGRQGA